MRIFSILTAAVVCTVLYFAILQRDALVDFAARVSGNAGPGDDAAEPGADPGGVTETAAEADTAGDDAVESPGGVHVVVRASTAEITEDALLLRGRTEAIRQVSVMAETTGRIVSDPVRAGASVAEGDLLCQIDTGTRAAELAQSRASLTEAEARLPEAEARLAEAQAALIAARIDNTAAERLSESGFASETRAASTAASLSAAEAAIVSAEAGVQGAQGGVLAAQAAVDRAEEELARLEIRAPFSGIIEADTAELGSLMQPGALCATVIQLDPVKLVGFVPETEVDTVVIGAVGGARLASGRDVQGTVTFLSRSADPETRTFRVEVTVDNADFSIRDGQTADILISTDGTSAHLLPSSALTLNDEGALGVRLAEDGIAMFYPVRVIRDTPTGVLVAGLPERADVIVVGQEFVTDGVPVRVAYEELVQ